MKSLVVYILFFSAFAVGTQLYNNSTKSQQRSAEENVIVVKKGIQW